MSRITKQSEKINHQARASTDSRRFASREISDRDSRVGRFRKAMS
jgi:hypothetical protein